VLSLVALAAVRLAFIVAFPFFVLVRGAVLFYRHAGAPTWLAVSAAGALMTAVVAAYSVWLARRVAKGSRPRPLVVVKWVAAPLVVSYCLFSLVYLARVNAKTSAVRAVYMSTHPLLRLAVATLVLGDHQAVVTDLGRQPDDYRRMGLDPNPQSLHLVQRDGWVHAVDIRTNGRGAVLNWFVAAYFRVMGFDVLRHVGTGDHLHVSLPVARR
jgi:hypothetical protein